MATVRALEQCYFNHRVYQPGAEFEYHGPEQSFLQLVSGEWTKKSLRSKQDELAAENADLRRRLARLEQLQAGGAGDQTGDAEPGEGDGVGAGTTADASVPQLPAKRTSKQGKGS